MFCATAMSASVNRPLPEAVVSAISASTAVKANDKYALDIGGKSGTTWNALRNKLRMGSLVLRVESGFADWWHGELKAGEHYLQVAPDLSNLQAQFDWAQANPVKARRIALAGQAKEAESSTWEAIDRETTRVLRNIIRSDCARF